MEANKNSKYYRDAYNNPSQKIDVILKWKEPFQQFQVDIMQGVKDAQSDRLSGNYKYK